MKSFLHALLLLLFLSSEVYANNHVLFGSFPSIESSLSTKEIKNLYRDKDGYMWIASHKGLYRFDGYVLTTYKSNIFTPDILTSNHVTCIAEDNNHKLWIGTVNGLNVLDKRQGNVIKIKNAFFNSNPISNILITRSNKIYIGTDRGFCEYIEKQDSCVTFFDRGGRALGPPTTVKGLIEDSDGFIWIGSWNDGLSRFDPKSGTFVCYPQVGAHNSAHTLYEDSHKRLWIGTWGEGVVMIENKFRLDSLQWRWFKPDAKNGDSILDNVVYSICEDATTGNIWVGGRRGVSIIKLSNSVASVSRYLPSDGAESLMHNEVNAIVSDQNGTMWLGMLGGGVCWARNENSKFKNQLLSRNQYNLPTGYVSSIWSDGDGLLSVGLFNYGFITLNPRTGELINSQINQLDINNTINSVYTSLRDGKRWISVYDSGIYVYDYKNKSYKHIFDAPWLSNKCPYAIVESADARYWIGTRYGLFLYDEKSNQGWPMLPDELRQYSFTSMTLDHDGRVWCGSSNRGIIRIDSPKLGVTSPVSYYNPKLNNNETYNIQVIFSDSRGRIWAGSEGYGLLLYNPKTDSFQSINKIIKLPTDVVNSILEDKAQNLWIGTDSGLIRLSVSSDINSSTYTLYTTADGLYDNVLSRAAYYDSVSGEMFFGYNKGYFSFFPEEVGLISNSAKVRLTDIKIAGTSWNKLDETLKRKISKYAPDYTKSISLPYAHKNLTIEFASLDMLHNSNNKYLYRLDGFDTQWQYVVSGNHQINYNNLPTGKYTLRIKLAHNAVSQNAASECIVNIEVLPPFWLTWWAYVIYFIFIITVIYVSYTIIRNRIRLTNRLKMQEMEKQQAEQVNQAKIRFFTNISHEFLTPLTVIAASVEELKASYPPPSESHYQVMTNNVNRLIRLMQQILEFRKLDTGNLKLKVLHGDLAQFAHNSFQNILPLMKRKGLHFIFKSNKESIPCWFDTDKIDKILYNLLSNAAKYNAAGGTVTLSIEASDNNDRVVITVSDDGNGFSREAMDSLFERFYDGDYRQHNTYGAGIGLSLAKSLAVLHGGDITVVNAPGTGAVLRVEIPTHKEAYNLSEIVEPTITVKEEASAVCVEETHESGEERDANPQLLLVEDNPDVLNLTKKILSSEYRIVTAEDGVEALSKIKDHDIDLIVSDVMMPKMNGLELTRTIKSDINYCHIPIVLLTVKSSQEDRVDIYESGADGYISKPFDVNVLKAKIRNLLKARARSAKNFKKQYVYEAKELDFTSMDEVFMQKAIDCIHDNMTNFHFDQVQFVEQMAVSRSTLYRKIKSLTGMNPSVFIRNVRLKEACRIIKASSSVRISELAYAVGFSDPKYFSSCFKKEFGIQPKEFIDQQSNSGA